MVFPYWCCCDKIIEPPQSVCETVIYVNDRFSASFPDLYRLFECCLSQQLRATIQLTRSFTELSSRSTGIVRYRSEIQGPPSPIDLTVHRLTPPSLILRSPSRQTFSTTASEDRTDNTTPRRTPEQTRELTAIVEVTLNGGISSPTLRLIDPVLSSPFVGEVLRQGVWQSVDVFPPTGSTNWRDFFPGLTAIRPFNGSGVKMLTFDESLSCGRLYQNYRTEGPFSAGVPSDNRFEDASNVDLLIDDESCCRLTDNTCISSGIAKSDDGWCCPISQFDTIVLKTLDAPTQCSDCLDIQTVEDGKYTTLPTISGTHYLTKVSSPPVGIDHQWQVKVAGVVVWEDGTSFDGSCAGLVARSAGDLVYQVSQVGAVWTVEVLLDITDAGPGNPFTDTVFRHAFSHPTDCAATFNRTVGNEITPSNWDCTGLEVPNVDLDVGHSGSFTLEIQA